VLLAGDASYDYKDNLGLGTVNSVPSYTVFTEYMGETLTDEWFARISGNDAVPDLYIGRLPAAKQVLLANGNQYEETSETFLLFGDPAMTLKIPLPRRPAGFVAEGEVSRVELSWQAAVDANDNPVSGYNLYRSTTPGGAYTRVNSELITETAYTDASLEGGAIFYYVVRSVDTDGDESVSSEERGVTVGSRALGSPAPDGGSSGGGCFINTVLSK